MHALSHPARLLLPGLLLLVAAGCGSRPYELSVRLPAGTVVHPRAKVFLDGVEVGTVTRVGRDGSKVLATVAFADRAVAVRSVRPGLIATVRKDRGIDLDTSEVLRSSDPLPSGSTIEGTTRFALLVRRYTRWQTVVVFFMGALGLLFVFWVGRAFFKLGWVLVALLLAGGAAMVAQEPMTRIVETVYSGEQEDDAAAAAPDSATPATKGEGGESILQIPKPSPGAVAFFVTWLAAFVAIQMLVGAALRATRSKA